MQSAINKRKSKGIESVQENPAKLSRKETDSPSSTGDSAAHSDMKIVSFNVSGIRAWIKKGGIQYIVKQSPDIVCLQETKCTKQKLPLDANVTGYHAYWLSGTKEGYCGVGLYTKKKPVEIKYGLGDKTMDEEARIITAEFENFFLINTYVPNSGRKLVTLPKRLKWDEIFRSHVEKLDGQKPVVLCGDMNVAHTEIDLKNPKTNTKNAGFTQEERDGFTSLLECGNGFIDTFRHLYPETIDAYTFWTYMGNARARNIGWRLDYFIVSKRLVSHVKDSLIHSDEMGSDHCPIVLLVDICNV